MKSQKCFLKVACLSLWASKGAKCFLQGINLGLLLFQCFTNWLLCNGGTKVHSSFCFSQLLAPRLVRDFHICLWPQSGNTLPNLSAGIFLVPGCVKYTQCIIYHLKHFFFFGLFRAVHVAYAGSQARGWIAAIALVYTTAITMPDLSCICDLHHSSWQRWILNPLSEAKDWTCILMDICQICFHRATMGRST